MGYKAKVCERCGKEYSPISGYQRYCSECGPLVRQETVKAGGVRRYNANRQKAIEKAKEWNKANPEKHKAYNLKYPLAIHEAKNAAWRAANPDKERRIYEKQNAQRRSLGFVPLNSWFLGCEAHHINPQDVVYIPKDLHRSLPHNLFTGKNMERINILAQQFLSSALPVTPVSHTEEPDEWVEI